MRRLGPLLALLLAFATHARADDPQAAAPQDEGPPPLFSAGPANGAAVNNASYLHFTPLRGRARTVLLAWGHDRAGDSERFRQAVKQASPVEEVRFLSGGGDLEEGIQIGRIMRASGLVAHIPAPYWCASACNFMFLGGVARSIDPGAEFIVHMFDRTGMSNDILDTLGQESAQATAAVQSQQAAASPAQGQSHGKPLASIAPGAANDAEPAVTPEPQTQPKAIDVLLQAYGCPGRTELQPDDLDKTIEAGLNKRVQDPVRRASIGAMLRALTLISLCIEQTDARQSAEIARFLVDMRLSLRFLTTFAAIPNARARALTRDELRDFNIVNTE